MRYGLDPKGKFAVARKTGSGVAAAIIFALVLVTAGPLKSNPLGDAEIDALSGAIFFGTPAQRTEAVEKLVARGKQDVVATLILASRYRGNDPEIMKAINTLTGQSLSGWHDAMLWQEAHPQIKPHASFRAIKTSVFNRIDPAFDRFIGGDRSLPENMKIRLEEITWGGVPVDGIPSLDNPKLINADEATYLVNSDLVFGVEINGDIRAYPLRIMGWHEMFNETIGGVSRWHWPIARCVGPVSCLKRRSKDAMNPSYSDPPAFYIAPTN